MPCPLQQELIEKVRRHLLNISELARRIAEAIANRNENTAAELDRQVDLKNVDLGIYRDFRITERKSLTFRAEMSNAFNLVNLSNPGDQCRLDLDIRLNQHDQCDAPDATRPALRILTLWENCYDRHDAT